MLEESPYSIVEKIGDKIVKKASYKTFDLIFESAILHTMGHPNIVSATILDFNDIHMEEAKCDLESYISKYDKTHLINEWTQDLFSGIAYLQKHDIIHMDLHLRNILVMKDYTLKICDFGIARIKHDFSDYFSPTLNIWDSPGPCAPELSVNKLYKYKSTDTWQLGAILNMIDYWETYYSYSSPKRRCVEMCLEHNLEKRKTAEEIALICDIKIKCGSPIKYLTDLPFREVNINFASVVRKIIDHSSILPWPQARIMTLILCREYYDDNFKDVVIASAMHIAGNMYDYREISINNLLQNFPKITEDKLIIMYKTMFKYFINNICMPPLCCDNLSAQINLLSLPKGRPKCSYYEILSKC